KPRLRVARRRGVAGSVPLDVSREPLFRWARQLPARYPGVEVLPLCADFTGTFRLPEPSRPPARRVVYFPGSTLGNFDPTAAAGLLSRVAGLCGRGGAMLLGIDLKKDLRLSEPPHNDARR